METLFVTAKRDEPITLPKTLLDNLPKTITLFTTAQFIQQQEHVIKQLEDNNIAVSLQKPRRTEYKGQLLGCSTTLNINTEVLYIGDGTFHPKALLIRNPKITVYTYNPIEKREGKVTEQDIKTIHQTMKKNYARFVNAKQVGILVSTKYGQSKTQWIERLKKAFPRKQWYVFGDDTFDFASLEDFPFVEFFVNTACERIGLDDSQAHQRKVMNAEDLIDMAKGRFDTIF
ncbi:MAG: diphthamide synthesis protein [Nanobdellota archaeon]